ncbi:MAG TPA: hypothetical protein VIG25_09330 [Pyrinomonadaceae bacterium]|jgi:hypothetical protein
MNYTIKLETGHINFSPVGFRRAAEDFLLCQESFRPPKFSVVPYFLCCRAIELALKAMHLESQTQKQVKKGFGHDLKASYDALPSPMQILSPSELRLLEQTNVLYMMKAFEYVRPIDAAHGYSEFPLLDDLVRLGTKLVAACA